MDLIRLSSAKRIIEATKDATSMTYLEAYAFENSCRRGHLHGIPIWHYATGTTLYECDKPETHSKEHLSSYLDLVELALAAWKSTPGIRSSPSKIYDIDPTNIESDSYVSWRDSYLSGVAHAKTVLEERQDTGHFIQCRKCKSNDVDTDQKQTRSADEPMTIFCRCRRCDTRFVMS